jgi:uncharacterized MAPEG superfamily protein
MVTCILIVLAIYLLSIFAPTIANMPSTSLSKLMGPRDDAAEPGVVVARLNRALNNLKESLPLFIPLSLLALIVKDVNMSQAVLGAQIFAGARLIYIPVYAAGIPGLRTAIWMISMGGMGMMAHALL